MSYEEMVEKQDTAIDKIVRQDGRAGCPNAEQIRDRQFHNHPSACDGSIVPMLSQPFHFFELPPELRCYVLRLLLKRSSEVRQMPSDHATRDWINLDVRLFAVCRQMRDEAERLFYAENTLRVCVDDSQEVEVDTFKLPPWVRTESTVMKNIRRVHISIGRVDLERLARIQNSLGAVVHALKLCQSLAVVKFTIHGYYPELEEPDMMFDMIMESFVSIRAVGNVLYADDGPVWTLYHNFHGTQAGTQAQREQVRSIMMSPKMPAPQGCRIDQYCTLACYLRLSQYSTTYANGGAINTDTTWLCSSEPLQGIVLHIMGILACILITCTLQVSPAALKSNYYVGVI